MELYDVIVVRVGVMQVDAASKLEAIELANRPEMEEKINWSTDWSVTDAEEADPFGTFGIEV